MAYWLIAGLGNPGVQYQETRHNVGFRCLDQLAQEHAVNFSDESKFHGQLARAQITQDTLLLLKPSVFMNRSGQSVAALARFYKIPPERILVIHDELDLNVGVVRLKKSGGHGGHNGLRDIITQLASRDFLRCRLGIGHPGHSKMVSNYVLSKASLADQENIDIAIEQFLRCYRDVISGELSKAMQWLHSQ